MALTPEQIKDLRERDLPSTGNKLALAIEIAAVKQASLVEELQFRPQYISDVACGRYRTITIENAWKFAQFFGCDPGDLFPAREETVSA